MKRILISLMTIAIVGTASFAGTKAYFSDTETSAGNILSTGTIDIAVDGQNPWHREAPYQLADMKPGQTGYANFTVQNVGTNPVNVLKKIDITDHSNSPVTQSECTAEGGTWSDEACSGNVPKDDLQNVIKYDLNVELFNPEEQLVWHQMLYNQNVTVAEIAGDDLFLGMVPEGWSMKVTQSYHMDEQAGNEYQGDSITFNITLTGEQLKGTLTLLPKTGDPNWELVYGGAQGTLTYGVKDATFNYTIGATGLTPSTSYSLIHYVDPWPGNGAGAIGLLGSGTTDGSGNLSLSGNTNLNANMINAKVWLVLSSEYNAGTKSLTAWDPSKWLFETGLINYYDSDL